MSSTTPSRGSSRSNESIRVLFVDTGNTTAEAVKPVFEDEFGIDVTIASRTEDVLRSLETVDCVVSEIRPPAFDGLDVLRDVRKSAPGLPYIVFSEVRTAELVGEALSAGATDYLRADADDAGYWVLASRVATTVAHYQQRTDGDRWKAPDTDVLDGSCLLDESLRFVAVSASYAELHGHDPEQLVGEPWATVFADDSVTALDDVVERVQSQGSAVGETTACSGDGRTFSALVSLASTTRERYVCTVFDRGHRPTAAGGDDGTIGLERALARVETLFATRFGDETSTVRDLCEAVVETIENENESAVVAVYLYDEQIDALRRRAVTPQFEGAAVTVPFDEESTAVWNAFVEREPALVADVHTRPDVPARDPATARGLVTPVGTHGVLVAGTLEGARPTPLDHAFVRLVGATTGLALDRLEARRRLDACDRRLEAATASTERLDSTVELVRGVARVIGGAWTRDELETRICEQLVSGERYAFARIATLDEVDEEIRDRAWAGSEKRYLESLDSSVSALVEQNEPMAGTIRTLESRVVRQLPTGPTDERWRQDAITRGYRSVVGVPLVFRERTYGGLTVYSERPSAFDETEREIFEALARWVAHAMHAIETRAALVGRGEVELEFDVRDRGIQFLEWARETGCTVEFETVVSRPNGSIHGFFTTDGASAETVLELANRSPSVAETRLVTSRGDEHLFECTFTEDSVVAHLLEYGVVPKAISTSEAGGHLVVSLPEHANVREFVDFFTRLYPDSTLVRRQDHEFVDEPSYGFRSELESALTAKQFEALETAFVSGYFEIPRDTTGEETAEVLGISQPTFNNHLRMAQRKLLSMVFADETDRDE